MQIADAIPDGRVICGVVVNLDAPVFMTTPGLERASGFDFCPILDSLARKDVLKIVVVIGIELADVVGKLLCCAVELDVRTTRDGWTIKLHEIELRKAGVVVLWRRAVARLAGR